MDWKITLRIDNFWDGYSLYEFNNKYYGYSTKDGKLLLQELNNRIAIRGSSLTKDGRYQPNNYSSIVWPFTLEEIKDHLKKYPGQTQLQLILDYKTKVGKYKGSWALYIQEAYDFLQHYVPFDMSRIFVAGGFFFRYYHGLPIRDIDVYANDDEIFEKTKKLYKEKYNVKMETDQYVRFEPYNKAEFGSDIAIDLIGFHTPRDQDWILNFDFQLCSAAMWESGRWFRDVQGIINKKIKINTNMKNTRPGKGFNNPISRLSKYLSMGCTIEDHEATELYKILLAAKEENLMDLVYP